MHSISQNRHPMSLGIEIEHVLTMLQCSRDYSSVEDVKVACNRKEK